MALSLFRAVETEYCIRVSHRLFCLFRKQLNLRHLIEPRFDEFKSASEKEAVLGGMSVGQDISLKPFKEVLGSTTLLSAGGYGPDNFVKAIESGTSDLVAFGRYFM
jgi:2,4-dienoyl-CoA reductase-like NADH-dependent reductase (Old Yellow Enzyme family)